MQKFLEKMEIMPKNGNCPKKNLMQILENTAHFPRAKLMDKHKMLNDAALKLMVFTKFSHFAKIFHIFVKFSHFAKFSHL